MYLLCTGTHWDSGPGGGLNVKLVVASLLQGRAAVVRLERLTGAAQVCLEGWEKVEAAS